MSHNTLPIKKHPESLALRVSFYDNKGLNEQKFPINLYEIKCRQYFQRHIVTPNYTKTPKTRVELPH